MNQHQAAALILYLNRCIGIVPTTGAEWMTIERALKVIELVANGQAVMEIKSPAPREVKDDAAQGSN